MIAFDYLETNQKCFVGVIAADKDVRLFLLRKI